MKLKATSSGVVFYFILVCSREYHGKKVTKTELYLKCSGNTLLQTVWQASQTALGSLAGEQLWAQHMPILLVLEGLGATAPPLDSG